MTQNTLDAHHPDIQSRASRSFTKLMYGMMDVATL
jgi:hypothetical protein